MTDPYLAGARALRQSLDKGIITRPQYDDMYAALAAAAESESAKCIVEGCGRAAYIGERCALHTDQEMVRRMVQEASRHVG